MGLDQYLNARLAFKPDSNVRRLFDSMTTDEQKKQARDPDWGGHYVSGHSWEGRDGHPGRTPDPLYVALLEEIGIPASPDSPHMTMEFNKHGDLVVDITIVYWRKTNSVHQWFVDHVQDGVDNCQAHVVHPEMLMDLVDRCERIVIDHDLADQLLPTQAGFFFGNTDYDEWYYKDLEATVQDIKGALTPRLMAAGATLLYESSW